MQSLKYVTCVSLAAEQLIRSYSSGSLQCPLSIALDPVTMYMINNEDYTLQEINIKEIKIQSIQ